MCNASRIGCLTRLIHTLLKVLTIHIICIDTRRHKSEVIMDILAVSLRIFTVMLLYLLVVGFWDICTSKNEGRLNNRPQT